MAISTSVSNTHDGESFIHDSVAWRARFEHVYNRGRRLPNEPSTRALTKLVSFLLCSLVTLELLTYSASASFRPNSAESIRLATLAKAVRANARDIPALTKAGAEVLGMVVIQGHGPTTASSIEDAAAEEAARYGATHYVASSAASRPADVSAPTQRVFVVLHVSPARIEELPESLRPVAGVHFDRRVTQVAARR